MKYCSLFTDIRKPKPKFGDKDSQTVSRLFSESFYAFSYLSAS